MQITFGQVNAFTIARNSVLTIASACASGRFSAALFKLRSSKTDAVVYVDVDSKIVDVDGNE